MLPKTTSRSVLGIRVLQVPSLGAFWLMIALTGAAASGGCSGEAKEGTVGMFADHLTSCPTGAKLKGVDVSSYQGTISWSAAHAQGIDFGFAKATEGVTHVDSTFARNWAGMKAAGVVRGAYHFFHPNQSASAQAAFVLSTVGPLGPGDLPIVLDFEVRDGVPEASAVAAAVTFLQIVAKGSGKTPILYMSSGFLSASYSSLAPYPLWVANYGVSCPGLPRAWSRWSFWQNTDSGSVSGIPGNTDTDFFNGSLAALTALAAGGANGGGGGGGATACMLAGKTYAENTCTETLECSRGAFVPRATDPASCATGFVPGGGCVTDKGVVVALNTCTATLQCNNGVWVDRMKDPAMCLGSMTTSCDLAGKTYAQNTCTETLQCDSGSWVARSKDPMMCIAGVEPGGACVTDTGAVVPLNTCTATLQCDNGIWVSRAGDPASCL